MEDDDFILGLDDWNFILEDIGVSIFPDKFDSDLSTGSEVFDSDSNKGYAVTQIVENTVYLKEIY